MTPRASLPGSRSSAPPWGPPSPSPPPSPTVVNSAPSGKAPLGRLSRPHGHHACSVSSCAKVFRRKEHLDRHVRSHRLQRPFQCLYCSRCYGRQDVLKRHVDNRHRDADSGPVRTLPACRRCHQRKARCDDSSPCRPCSVAGEQCVRPSGGAAVGVATEGPVLQGGRTADPDPAPSPAPSTATGSESRQAWPVEQDAGCVNVAVGHSPTYKPQSPPLLPIGDANPRSPQSSQVELAPKETPPAMQQPLDCAERRTEAFHIGRSENPVACDGENRAQDGEPIAPQQANARSDTPQAPAPAPNPTRPTEGVSPMTQDSLNRPMDTQPDFSTSYIPSPPSVRSGPQAAVQVDAANPLLPMPLDELDVGFLSFSNDQYQTWAHGVLSQMSGMTPHTVADNAVDQDGSVRKSVSGGAADSSPSSDQVNAPELNDLSTLETSPNETTTSFEIQPSAIMGFESDGESIQLAFDSYFKNFHPLWPILHLPTFVAATEPKELTNTVVMIGAWKLKGDYWVRKARCLQIHLIDTLQKQLLALSIEQEGEPYWPLKIYQAVLLNVAFGLESSDDLMYPRCYLLFNMMISIFRRVGIFDEQRIIAQDKPKEVGTRRWINREQLKRLAFHAMRCDSYFQYLCYYPPVLRPEELCLTLPCSNLLWEVPTLSLWLHAKLDEPKGRISRDFASLLFDAISNDESRRARMPNLLEEDYLFGLCAIQPWIWEQVQRGRLSHQQPRGSLQRSDPSYLDFDAAPDKGLCDRSYWRHQLDLWRVSYDQDKELGFKSSSIFHIITLRFNCRLFYHLSYLALYTDLQLIDDISINRSLPFSGAIRRKREAAAEAWATTSDARLAMWHAGQILKVWHEELTASTAKDFTPGTDIISYVALFKAGIVTWAYTRATRSCDLCRIETELGQPPPISVLDLAGNSEAADLETWIDGGGREAIGGTLVCACNLADLVGRFEECLGGCPRGSSVRRMGETLASLKEQY